MDPAPNARSLVPADMLSHVHISWYPIAWSDRLEFSGDRVFTRESMRQGGFVDGKARCSPRHDSRGFELTGRLRTCLVGSSRSLAGFPVRPVTRTGNRTMDSSMLQIGNAGVPRRRSTSPTATDPNSVDSKWRAFFAALDDGCRLRESAADPARWSRNSPGRQDGRVHRAADEGSGPHQCKSVSRAPRCRHRSDQGL